MFVLFHFFAIKNKKNHVFFYVLSYTCCSALDHYTTGNVIILVHMKFRGYPGKTNFCGLLNGWRLPFQYARTFVLLENKIPGHKVNHETILFFSKTLKSNNSKLKQTTNHECSVGLFMLQNPAFSRHCYGQFNTLFTRLVRNEHISKDVPEKYNIVQFISFELYC